MYAVRPRGTPSGPLGRVFSLLRAVRGFLSTSASSFGVERGCGHVRASETWTTSHNPGSAFLGLRRPGRHGFGPARRNALPSSFPRVPQTAFPATHRALSTGTVIGSCPYADELNFFEYTSGRWVYNEAQRMKERTTVFNVDGLARLAAECVGRTAADVVRFTKYAEGHHNREFLVELRDGLKVVAYVPYPATGLPHALAVASEVATTVYMRRHGVPVPEIYGYAVGADNAAGIPYIVREFVEGESLMDVGLGLEPAQLVAVVRQLVQVEARVMALPFPAGGSIYFTQDLEKLCPGLAVPLEDPGFCVGPDTVPELWYGRRAGLEVHRGPYKNSEEALAAPAHKEIAHLKQFGQPLQPLRRERRLSYKFKEQCPSYHVDLLERYLALAPSLVPKDPALRRFCIRYPDLNASNIMIAWSPDSTSCTIVGLLDWKHTSIQPLFLRAGVTPSCKKLDDYQVSESTPPPALPENFGALSVEQRKVEMTLYRLRLVQYHYIAHTREVNKPHYDALTDSLSTHARSCFEHALAPWAGDSYELKTALIEVSQRWGYLERGGAGGPCPIGFEDDDVDATTMLGIRHWHALPSFVAVLQACSIDGGGKVDGKGYEAAMANLKTFREYGLATAKWEDDRLRFGTHWPWGDMDEEPYM